ncbi:MAG: M13 family metallopeptidase [Candidatus Eisenbacteria bacterium]|nr:M13 family metallopeptidase [Candidatus Eisenbacteria bacterium]
MSALLGLTVLMAPNHAASAATPELGEFGVDLKNRKTSVRPQDDFFRHANGQWLDTFEIPADLASYGPFVHLFLRSENNVKAIVSEAAAMPDVKPGSLSQKIGDMYNDFVDDKTREARGLEPMSADLEKIKKAKSHDDVAALLAEFSRLGATTPFNFSIQQDSKDPAHYRPHLGQGGLALPDRDYYLDRENPRFANAREAYQAYLVKLLTFAGRSEPARRAGAILTLETALAKAHWPAEETRDVEKTYNKMSRKEMEVLAPKFPWAPYLAGLELDQQPDYIVMMPSAIAGMGKVFSETPVEVWQDFVATALLRNNAAFLPESVDDANFTFFSTAVTGAKQKRERWRRGTQLINGTLGEAVGRLYVERHFTPEAKSRVDELVNNLIAAMAERIDTLEWMSAETKVKAHEKLAKFNVKIGYPKKWRDYFALDVRKGDLLGNVNRSRELDYDFELSKLDKPVDLDEWFLTPQTVNAYYNPSMNEIVFPAAILQPPFFDAVADDAVNYGGIGAVIGHEIGHGFDDQGRKSDGNGVLTDWWTEADAERFKQRADMLVKQYSAFSPLEGMNVNGELTLGENIGDLGGLEIAYHAYHLSLKGKEAPVIDGLTGDQRFFLGYAQIWQGKMRDALMATVITSDPHSPNEFRVNGTLRNVDAFYEAFNLKSGDAMFLAPEERVRIW